MTESVPSRANTRSGLFAATALVLALALTAGVQHAAAGPKDTRIKVRTGDGKEVVVPTEGALSDETASAIASSVQEFDRSAKKWKKPRGTSNASLVETEMQAIAREARNESVDQLDLALRIAKRTSGVPGAEMLDSAKSAIAAALSIMKTKPPASLFVATDISASIPQGKLHYCSKGDLRRPDCWQSYTPGARLRIGRYVFRVESAARSGQPYEEAVLVLQDPTVLTIIPRN